MSKRIVMPFEDDRIAFVIRLHADLHARLGNIITDYLAKNKEIKEKLALKKSPPKYFGARIEVLEKIGIGSDKLIERLKNFNNCRNSLGHEADISNVEFYGIGILRKKAFKSKIEKEYRSLFRQLNKLANEVCEGVYVKPYVKTLQN